MLTITKYLKSIFLGICGKKCTHKIERVVSGSVALTILSCATAWAQSPVLLWQSDPVSPGEIALFAGADLGIDSVIEFRRLIDDPEKLTANESVRGIITQATETMVKTEIPSHFINGVYSFFIKNKYGKIEGQLNSPNIYWWQGDSGQAVTPGGWLRLAGRNIVRTSSARLALKNSNGTQVRKLTATSSSAWDAQFDIPQDLLPGRYSFKLWNGNGDASSQASGHFEIIPAPNKYSDVFDVKKYGAKGDGKNDDWSAFKAATEAIQANGGGTLLLPRGTYLISSTIKLPPYSKLTGIDRDSSVIILKDSENPPEIFIEGTTDFSITNITLLALNHWHLISAGLGSDKEAYASNVTIDNIVIRASFYRGYIKPDKVQARYLKSISVPGNGPDAIRLHGRNINITRSDIQSSVRSLAIIESNDVLVRNNRLMNGRRGWYLISNSERIIFENNEITGADLQASGGGINSLFSRNRLKWTRNVLFKENRSSFHNGADGEAMTSDGPGGCYLGPIETQAGSAIVKLLGQDFDSSSCTSGGLMITGGRGLGQHAIIKNIIGNTLHLDRPLVVTSNTSTVGTVTPVQENYLMIGNSASDTGLALQAFGASVNTVMAGNKSLRTAGFSIWSGPYQGPGQSNMYAQIINNEVIGGYMSNYTNYDGATSFIRLKAEPAPKFPYPMIRGAVIRSNTLSGNSGIQIIGKSTSVPTISDIVIEKNSITKTAIGIEIQNSATGVIVRNNTFDEISDTPIINISTPGASW